MSLYKEAALQFSDSRDYFEPGWNHLLELDLPGETKLLDVGCGNGRLFRFFETKSKVKIAYTGLDSSKELLSIAASKNVAGKYLEIDLTKEFPNLEEKYDLITVHALLHHIPKFERRKEIILTLSQHLNSQGYLHISFWQFGEYSRYQNRTNFDPELVGMKQSELEENDYVLDWRRGSNEYRFCHFATLPEIEKYNQSLQSAGLGFVTNYRADGREGDQNWYWLWQKL